MIINYFLNETTKNISIVIDKLIITHDLTNAFSLRENQGKNLCDIEHPNTKINQY